MHQAVVCPATGMDAAAITPSLDAQTSPRHNSKGHIMKKLIKGGFVVTMDPDLPDLVRGEILVEGDRIAAIGQDLAVEDAEVVDAFNCIVAPGLINAHVHTWQTGLRGIAGDWTVPEYMRAMHRGLATYFRPDDIRIANLVGSLNQLNCGCTTIVDWCHNNPTPEHTDAAVAGLEESGVRAMFLHGSPKPNPKPGQKHFSEVPMPRGEIERLRTGRLSSDEGLVTLGLAILGPEYSTFDVTVQDMRLAREFDLLASVHVGGGSMLAPDGFDHLVGMGLADRRLNIVHGNSLSDATLGRLVEAGATVTVTADVEMQMGFGDPVTGRLRALGAPVSIGVDVEPAVGGDLFTTMRVTLQVQRNLDILDALKRGRPVPDTTTITCREALEWATINGARMIRQDHRIGSLTPGKQADLIFVKATDLNIFPVHDPISSLVLQAGVSNVDAVMLAGRWVKQNGTLQFEGLDQRKQELLASGQRILGDVGLLKKAA